ncbi:general transcriptional corepressor trfA [Zeugodacus cucurbitae]|uniref:general transcriptional corepressor trfA n=1 Tax=Zeugodacus cucurbitae TaxID=28588 RepID=UPI0005967E2F|nr:general transcriptional corepressor trfA [Zeugodacus cucurbitae]XP_011179997.1 general transcriptional corepressor trfA [Zeugodacus cucurbitae]XP_011179999.1 general transcriptional corepressor trfA [Zeugodacus cucurbitae]XP_054086597.1 general transcriptional corepressor trfA [Zeugodacus cucurbitae]XP_054086598.1 general transcriptional corepressor trfA [Zeugodacus cucurbitae]XP_054086599.1 general transcriptional corepressor trfA [Zeugodacus cucurbitae]XP_054086600.1 general transcriptio
MALRLRRDVQKASYYVWFLGAEEAKGLRGTRVINSVLPYLIDRSRGQEPLKVTLQVSHKGIKILQGSSKHFIPHSAITSSVQTDDIVACVLLLYNPATKCPLHVHAYRCDSESTAEALHQQLQILINRPDNQKRFEELETRLGILPPLPTSGGSSNSSNGKSAAHMSSNGHSNEHSNSSKSKHYLSQQQQSQLLHQQQQQHQRRHDSSPKRFSSSLGSDTGNSTRESECSEEHSGGSPVSRSPPVTATTKPLPLPQPTSELFDSLAAELRAKLNGNGPPLLLPPRDYDTVHRSKGNLTAIELRRCRNALIVGGATPNETAVPVGGKQVSSRGSSGIGSDLAPSPERQDLNSSSEDEQWSNEADNSVIALKPSQIAMERSPPIIPHHPQLNRKSAVQPPEDSYLRDLPAKPYTPRQSAHREKIAGPPHERDSRSKTPSTASWSREDEIKPIIMRPADYDAKFNRVMQAETKQEYYRRADGGGGGGGGGVSSNRERDREREHPKLRDSDKYNEINRLLNKKLSLERETPDQRLAKHKLDDAEEFNDSDPASDHMPVHPSSNYRKENLTDKQKFIEYAAKKQSKSYAVDEAQRYGGRHRYVDPADLPFEQTTSHNKYAAAHRSTHSPERSDLGHSRSDLGHTRSSEHDRDREREPERLREREREREKERERERERERDRDHERKEYSRSNQRNPYREPESLPYIQSMEKMMKSSAMRYKAFDGAVDPTAVAPPKEELHTKLSSQHSKSSYTKRVNDEVRPIEYAHSNGRSDVTPKDRFKDAKDKFRAMERTGSRYDLAEDKDISDYRPRNRGSVERADNGRPYADWSDEERLDDSPPPPPVAARSRSRSRGQLWEESNLPPREMIPPREHHLREHGRERAFQEYAPDMRATREASGKRLDAHRVMRERSNDMTDGRDPYRDAYRYEQRAVRDHSRDTPHVRDERERERHREPLRREYSPDVRAAGAPEHRANRRQPEKHTDYYPPATPPPPTTGAPIPNPKGISNLTKGYRHSYAEPVFARAGGRVGLAAVNPY